MFKLPKFVLSYFYLCSTYFYLIDLCFFLIFVFCNRYEVWICLLSF